MSDDAHDPVRIGQVARLLGELRSAWAHIEPPVPA